MHFCQGEIQFTSENLLTVHNTNIMNGGDRLGLITKIHRMKGGLINIRYLIKIKTNRGEINEKKKR